MFVEIKVNSQLSEACPPTFAFQRETESWFLCNFARYSNHWVVRTKVGGLAWAFRSQYSNEDFWFRGLSYNGHYTRMGCVRSGFNSQQPDYSKHCEFCGRPLKDPIKRKRDFCGICWRRQTASRWAGSALVRAQIVAQSGFALRSVIATKLNFFEIKC